jgi:amino acid transporter
LSRQVAVDRVAEVEARSAGLRKELGLVDLVLMQIMYVVGSAWVGTAAKLGSSHTVFWLLAIVLYYLPQAAVVIFLARLMPLEGGLYQWTSIALGRFAGFMLAWNLWAYAVLIGATFGVTIATNAAYLLSGSNAALSQLWWYTPVVSTLALLLVTMISVIGLRLGRWVQDVGGAAHVLTFAALLIVPLVALRHGRPVSYHPLDVAAPSVSLFSLNIFGKMALGALSGFEYVAIMAGETRSASRNITRSVLVAAPIIVLMFILGTDSVIALVPRDRIDLVSPIPQALTFGFEGSGIIRLIVPALILLLVLRQLGVVTMVFNGNTRRRSWRGGTIYCRAGSRGCIRVSERRSTRFFLSAQLRSCSRWPARPVSACRRRFSCSRTRRGSCTRSLSSDCLRFHSLVPRTWRRDRRCGCALHRRPDSR